MKPSTKAAYLSAFLFPGSGHIFLKCHIRGVFFILIAIIGLYIVMGASYDLLKENILTGKLTLDADSIQSVIQQLTGIYKEPTLMAAKGAMLASWLVSTIDAYRIGKKQEQSEHQN